mgnify:CR=1 FL=1
MFVFFFQAEDGIRDAQESRGLGDVYKRQGLRISEALNLKLEHLDLENEWLTPVGKGNKQRLVPLGSKAKMNLQKWIKAGRPCLLYTSDAADDLLCVDLGGRRIIKKKNKHTTKQSKTSTYTT